MNFSDSNIKMNLAEGEVSKILIAGLASNLEMFITIPELVAVRLEGSLP